MNRREIFKQNFSYQADYIPQIETILHQHAGMFLQISVASTLQDTKQATDMVINVSGAGTIAVRIRRPDCRFRDFTVRAAVPSGYKTELSKLKEGWGDWYIYAWEDSQGWLSEYVLIDLRVVRRSGVLDTNYRQIPNPDGTRFISIPLARLKACNALVTAQLNPSNLKRLNSWGN